MLLIGTLGARPRTEGYCYSLYHTTRELLGREQREGDECLEDFLMETDFNRKGCTEKISPSALVMVPVAGACYPGSVQGLALTLCSFCFLDRDRLYPGLTKQPRLFKINTLYGLLLGNRLLDVVSAESRLFASTC